MSPSRPARLRIRYAALAGAAHPHTHGAAALCLAAAFLLWLVRLGPKVRPLDRPLS